MKLFNKTENLSKEQKERLLAIVAQNRQLEKDVVVDWPRLTEKHKEYNKSYGIQFDENDELQLSDEDKIKYYRECMNTPLRNKRTI